MKITLIWLGFIFVPLEKKLNDDLIIINPFIVHYTLENSELFGEIKELEIYSYGNSFSEVNEDLTNQLIDLYNIFLNKSNDQLGEDPIRWKSLLKYHIKHD